MPSPPTRRRPSASTPSMAEEGLAGTTQTHDQTTSAQQHLPQDTMPQGSSLPRRPLADTSNAVRGVNSNDNPTGTHPGRAEADYTDQPRYTASDVDYEKKYAPDAYGEELSDKARVWSVYIDEAQLADAEFVGGLDRILDVLLVFAGLFSAVVTTFVAQSSQLLSADYAQISASLLFEIAQLQRALATGSSVNAIPTSQLSPNSRTHTDGDVWVNGLWMTSLALSLVTALVSVLAKQWLQHFNSMAGDSPRVRACVRQYRFDNFNQWKVPFIISFLPALLSVSLLLFLGLSAGAFLIYSCVSILPILVPRCAYKTPISDYIITLIHWISQHILVAIHLGQVVGAHICPWLVEKSQLRTHSYSRPTFLKRREVQDAMQHWEYLASRTLYWLCHSSANTTAARVALQAVSALPSHIPNRDKELYACVFDVVPLMGNIGVEPDSLFVRHIVDIASTAERLGRVLLRVPVLMVGLAQEALWRQLFDHRDRLSCVPHVDMFVRLIMLFRFSARISTVASDYSLLEYTLAALDLPAGWLSTVGLHPLVWRELEIALRMPQHMMASSDTDFADAYNSVVQADQICDLDVDSTSRGRQFASTAMTLAEFAVLRGWQPGQETLSGHVDQLREVILQFMQLFDARDVQGGGLEGKPASIGQQGGDDSERGGDPKEQKTSSIVVDEEEARFDEEDVRTRSQSIYGAAALPTVHPFATHPSSALTPSCSI